NNEPRALKWDAELAQWTLIGMAEEYRNSQEQQKILDTLKGKEMTAKEIATAVEMPYDNVRQIIYRMEGEKKVRREGGNQAKGYTYVATERYYNHYSHNNQKGGCNNSNSCNAPLEAEDYSYVWEYQLSDDPAWKRVTLSTDDYVTALDEVQAQFGKDNVRDFRQAGPP
ncbi:MAG: hypothetical protein OEU91_12140, partial [Gammaproteobacteria bacterium]|nr:hypothetical protein [Gammaproteobacteria bacterium]